MTRFIPLILALLWAPMALAADEPILDDARAVQLYENGARLYEEGLYAEAIEAFEASLKLSGRAELHFNIANAYERLGDLDNAIQRLNRYRIYATGDQRVVVERRLRNLEARRQRELEAASVVSTEPAVAPATKAASERPPMVATPPERRNLLKPVLLITGGGLTVIGGTTATVAYSQGTAYGRDKEYDRYDDMRTVNQAGLYAAGAGIAALIGGLLVPGNKISVSPTAGGLQTTSSWRF